MARLAVLLASLALVGCVTHYDYGFKVSGRVVDPSGSPIQGVLVTLVLGDTVYEAIEPVRRREVSTDKEGRYSFLFISDAAGADYFITFDKPGYNGQRIRGSGLGGEDLIVLIPNKTLQRTRFSVSGFQKRLVPRRSAWSLRFM